MAYPLKNWGEYPLIELANDEFLNRLIADILEVNDITFDNLIYTDNIEQCRRSCGRRAAYTSPERTAKSKMPGALSMCLSTAGTRATP